MAINKKSFFDYVRGHLFDGSLKPSQVEGLTAILNRWEGFMAAADDRWLAYILATAHHETGRTMQPVRETFAATDDAAIKILEKAYKAGKLAWVKHPPYWRRDADGKSWLGRGLVQLTHKFNYERMSTATGVDLVARPELAMDLATSVEIIFHGMVHGSFTGKKLVDYFAGANQNWEDARRIINGNDKKQLVASYGREYYAAISYTTG